MSATTTMSLLRELTAVVVDLTRARLEHERDILNQVFAMQDLFVKAS